MKSQLYNELEVLVWRVLNNERRDFDESYKTTYKPFIEESLTNIKHFQERIMRDEIAIILNQNPLMKASDGFDLLRKRLWFAHPNIKR